MKSITSLTFTLLTLAAGSALAVPSALQLSNLTCGTNANWFGNGPLRFDEPKAALDLTQLNEAGVRHLRLYLFTEGLAMADNPSKPRPEVVAEISKGIAFANRQGLAVILNPFHASPNSRYVLPRGDSQEADNMVKLWGALAAHLSSTDPNLVFFEIASEPTYDDPVEWEMLQIRCHKAIREAAPGHLIIATANAHLTPHDWDQVGALAHLSLLPDADVVYNFHYTGPMPFTLQDQTTSQSRFPNHLKGIPYPSSPDNIAPLLGSIEDPYLRDQVKAYGEARWNAGRIRSDFQRAAEWARSRNVALTCNEFGVQRQSAPPADRIAYLADVHTSLAEFGIGWTLWGDNCGILRREANALGMDMTAAKALGLVR